MVRLLSLLLLHLLLLLLASPFLRSSDKNQLTCRKQITSLEGAGCNWLSCWLDSHTKIITILNSRESFGQKFIQHIPSCKNNQDKVDHATQKSCISRDNAKRHKPRQTGRQLEDLANGCIKQPIIRHEPRTHNAKSRHSGRVDAVEGEFKAGQSLSKLKLSKATQDRRGQVWGQVAGRGEGEGAAWHAIEKFAL